jgi:hypothetical protein
MLQWRLRVDQKVGGPGAEYLQTKPIDYAEENIAARKSVAPFHP